MITRRILLSVLTLAALLAGCEDEFLTGSSINRMRLLGMKVRPDEGPEAAWLQPGSAGRFDFSVALADPERDDPPRDDPRDDLKSMMIHCTKAEILDGQPQCAEVIALAFQAQQTLDAGVPDGGPVVDEALIDATLMALREGIPCASDPENGEEPFDLAQLAIQNIQVTNMPARLLCPTNASTTNLPRFASDTVPSDYAVQPAGRALGLDDHPDRLVQGVICEYGEPVFKSEPPFFGCKYEVGSDTNLPERAPIAEVFFYTVRIAQDGQSNLHPLFAQNDPIRRANLTGGATKPTPLAWASTPAPAACDDTVDPGFVLDYSDKSLIAVGVDAAREASTSTPSGRESYQVETYVTYGELDRQYSVVDELDEVVPDGEGRTKSVIEVEWEHGKAPVPNRNTLARFYFVIRDGRGGFAIDERWLCLCRDRQC